MPNRILIVAATTGYQTRMFAAAAARMGLEAVLATDRCHILDDPWGDSAIPVRFEKPRQSVEAVAAAGSFAGVVAVGDRPALLAAHIAARLGLRFSAPKAVEAARNKFLARQRFRAAGLPVPRYERVALDADPESAARRVSYPCVLKPLGLSGSRGVIRADDPADFSAAFHRIRDILALPEIRRQGDAADRYLLVEEFIPGRELAIEGVVTGGRLQVLAIFDKPDPLDGPFFEETIYVTPSREPANERAALTDAVQRAVGALGLSEGPVHAEARINDRGVWMLEVAPRPIGGLCAKALCFNGGMPLEELILRHSAGEDVTGFRREAHAAGVMMIPIPRAGVLHGVSGTEAAQAEPGVEEVIVTAKQGQALVPLPVGSSYLGFIFARGGTPGEVEAALRRAHDRLHFEILAKLPVAAG